MAMTPDRLLRNLDWNLLHTFVTIVDEGSITAAAHKLAYSQPSVSNALKRLEDSLGTVLLVRKKGTFTLTHKGRMVYEYATSANTILVQMADQFARQDAQLGGELAIQIASHIFNPPFDQSLKAFHADHPDVLITINTHPSKDILKHLMNREVNIGLSNMKSVHSTLNFELIGYEEMGFYCGPDHPLFGKENASLDELGGLPYISFESDQPGEGLSDIAQLRASHRNWGRTVAISSNEEEVRRLIVTGLGFGALTVEGAKAFVSQGLLWPININAPLPSCEVYLATPAAVPLTEAEARFVSLLRQSSAEFMRRRFFSQGGVGLMSLNRSA